MCVVGCHRGTYESQSSCETGNTATEEKVNKEWRKGEERKKVERTREKEK